MNYQPLEILGLIFENFTLRELKTIRMVSKLWSQIGLDLMLRLYDVIDSYVDFQTPNKSQITNLKLTKPLFYIPPKLTTLILCDVYYDLIDLPPTLKNLSIELMWNSESKIILPPNLEYYSTGYFFNREFRENDLPLSLKTLILGYCYNKPIHQHILPNKLNFLRFGYSFDQSIKGVLPPALIELEFGEKFNQEFNERLPNLLNLKFGMYFNNVFDPHLPNLKYLSFGMLFTKSIKGKLPSSLIELHLGHAYNQTFDMGDLPISLRKLVLGYFYSKPFGPNVLPSGLKKLYLNKKYYEFNKMDYLPKDCCTVLSN